MTRGELLTALGHSSADRVVVLHADDIGMCQATVAAYREISARGIISAASAMVPCSWFPAIAEMCRDDGSHDMGVHLTLTAEWRSYRWAPLCGPSVAGLCGSDGYFYAHQAAVQSRPLADQVHRELSAQVARARAAGLDVSHLDSHMFTLMHRDLIGVYARVAAEQRVPCVLLPLTEGSFAEDLIDEDRSYVVEFDAWAGLPLDSVEDRLDVAKRLLDALPCGLSYFLSHPAVDSPELRAIAPDWQARVADYALYRDDRWARALEAAGVKVTGMRCIRAALENPEQRSRVSPDFDLRLA